MGSQQDMKICLILVLAIIGTQAGGYGNYGFRSGYGGYKTGYGGYKTGYGGYGYRNGVSKLCKLCSLINRRHSWYNFTTHTFLVCKLLLLHMR